MPLRVAILWHQHQPYYKQGDRYLLPWTRLHGTKDYFDIAAALSAFPRLRQTINVAPSLLIQLLDYANGDAVDRALELTEIPAAALGVDEKVEILRSFFLCNVERMIRPYDRYAELYERAARDRADAQGLRDAAALLSVQDWLDLQVWYNLTWVGEYSRSEEPFSSLLRRGRDFTEQDKANLLAGMQRIIAHVIPAYRELLDAGRIELSVTPFYHPILPLLCDSRSALEAMPGIDLPRHLIRYPEDATVQIRRAIDLFTEQFGGRPHGMWPSEGSVSTESMQLVAAAGLEWIASDEGVLRRTLGDRWHPLAKYFPYRLETGSGPLWALFRDHELSDAIGFVYSSWTPEGAALDFYNRLVEIRSRILQELGPAGLEQAVVPVILDGENCWEYYEQNGRPFLEALYGLLETSGEIETTTIHDALASADDAGDRVLDGIFAGSWVGTNFKIWIGHAEDNEAWDAIAEARDTVLAARPGLDEETMARAMEHIYIAEGSDWFWWFGEENSAANQDDFDALFRSHLTAAYDIVGENVPATLAHPIRRASRAPAITSPTGLLHPALTGNSTQSDDWRDSGWFRVESVGGAMHRAESFERNVRFGADGIAAYLRLDIGEPLRPGHEIRLTLTAERSVVLRFTRNSVAAELPVGSGTVEFNGLSAAIGSVIDTAVPLRMLSPDGATPHVLGVAFELYEHGHPVERVPRHGDLPCPLIPTPNAS